MAQEIKYNGQTAIPNDYNAPDGDLEISLNVINEDGGLKPIPEPKKELKTTSSLDASYNPRIVFIHTTSNFTHYIYQISKRFLVYFDKADATQTEKSVSVLPFTTDIKQVNGLGNTLCVLCEDSIYYFYFNADLGAYTPLPKGWPDVRLSFGLKGIVKSSETFTPTFSGSYQGSPPIVAQSSIVEFTDSVMARVNKLVSDITESEQFCMPFFIRYALRMHDGSLVSQSAPILMLPTYGSNPIVFMASTPASSTTTISQPHIAHTIACDIDMQCVNLSNIEQYSDIIKSVDIFVSAPIYTYDQSGECREYAFATEANDAFGIYSFAAVNQSSYDNLYSYRKTLNSIVETCHYNLPDANRQDYKFIVRLPKKNNLNTEIADCADFYFLKSIPIEELTNYTTNRTVLKIEKGTLKSINTRERLTDDYDSHDEITAGQSFVYNARFHIFDLKKKLFDGYYSQCYQNEFIYKYNFINSGSSYSVDSYDALSDEDTSSITHRPYVLDLYVYIKRNGKTYILREDLSSYIEKEYMNDSVYKQILFGIAEATGSNSGTITSLYNNATKIKIPYFYHPDPNAYKVVIFVNYNTPNAFSPSAYSGKPYLRFELTLKRHTRLNGAYFFDGFEEQEFEASASMDKPTASTDKTILLPNKIYVSEVENPFYFPVSHIATIGTNIILKLGTAAQALSQGQFGQFPLYAFCSDGVWALSVSDVGSYKAVQPITRDVCTNPDSVTPIDGAVLFTTDRGIMLVEGSHTTCISDTISDQFAFDLSQLPGLNTLNPLQDFEMGAFSNFLSNCQMLYDYPHQRIIIFNASTHMETIDAPEEPPVVIEPEPIITEENENESESEEESEIEIDSDEATTNSSSSSQRIVRNYNYAYVYSLKSKKWGMMQTDIYAKVPNAHPEALAMAPTYEKLAKPNAWMVNFSAYQATPTIPTALILTRPLKLGAADILKTVHSVVQRGYMDRSDVKVVMYASRNLKDWHLISSSTDGYLRHVHGSPWKYFRFAIIANLAPDETLVSATVQVENRYTNRLR